MDERRKHGWLFWFAIGAILLPFVYVASFGPLAWIATWGVELNWWNGETVCPPLLTFYWPLFCLEVRDYPWGHWDAPIAYSISHKLYRYEFLFAPPGY